MCASTRSVGDQCISASPGNASAAVYGFRSLCETPGGTLVERALSYRVNYSLSAMTSLAHTMYGPNLFPAVELVDTTYQSFGTHKMNECDG